MVQSVEQRRCGARVERCVTCANTVGSRYDTCPKCGSNEFEESTCRIVLAATATRCSRHGGRSPQVLNKQAVVDLETEAAQILVANGHEAVTNPLAELMEVLGEQRALKQQLGQAVNELQSLSSFDLLGRENLRAVLDAYTRTVDRYASMLIAASKLNVDDRVVAIGTRIAKAQGDLIFDGNMAVIGAFVAPEFIMDFRRAMVTQLEWMEEEPDQRGPAPVFPQFQAPSPVVRPAEPPVRPAEPLELNPAPVVAYEAPEPTEPSVVDVEVVEEFDPFADSAPPPPQPMPSPNIVGQVGTPSPSELAEMETAARFDRNRRRWR